MMRICEKKCKVAQAAILAMEILLLPTGLISTFLILKDSSANHNNPFCFLHSLFCNLRDHCLRCFSLSLLSSPFFICLFINSIVLLILLSSSKFHHRKTQPYHDDLFSYDAADNIPAVVNAPPLPLSPAGTLPFDDEDTMSGEGVDVKEHQNPEVNEEEEAEEEEEEEDTIEATWEAISGGGGKEKQSSKLKKCETWPRPPPATTTAPEPLLPSSATAATSWKELRKSVTFNDAVSACRRGGLARDLLRSPEEMNKRFDDFIRKVNHELRLQRQESEQRFLEVINRGL